MCDEADKFRLIAEGIELNAVLLRQTPQKGTIGSTQEAMNHVPSTNAIRFPRTLRCRAVSIFRIFALRRCFAVSTFRRFIHTHHRPDAGRLSLVAVCVREVHACRRIHEENRVGVDPTLQDANPDRLQKDHRQSHENGTTQAGKNHARTK